MPLTRWNDARVTAIARAKMATRLNIAAIMLENEIKKSFGAPPSMPKDARNKLGKPISEKRWRETHHSKPYEPPFVQTGNLCRSIHFDAPSELRRRVGSTLKPQGGPGSHSYAWYLERGTSRMAPRPYLVAALRRIRGSIRAVLSGKTYG